MTQLRTNLIDAYRWLTLPYRSFRLQQLSRRGQVPVAILFYHRVDNQYANPWTISEQGFLQQIEWIQKRFDLVSLAECQRRIDSGYNQRPTLSITFDDGYADNCAFALPLLMERNIPVTYFVTTEHTTHNKPFPHDTDRDEPLAPNSIESLRALAEAGVEIGGHTRTHADLGAIQDSEVLFDEVIAATKEMERAIDRPIRYFAFPFGQPHHLNPAVFHLLREHGFAGACSAYGGMNEIGGDSFHLQRIHGDPNFSRIKNWLTFDSRMESVPRYDYHANVGHPHERAPQ